MESVEREHPGAISFLRSTGTVLGGSCDACSKKGTIAESDFGLVVELKLVTFTLCKRHEGILLERLLTNYVKRLKRGSKVGFIGPIPKTEVEESI